MVGMSTHPNAPVVSVASTAWQSQQTKGFAFQLLLVAAAAVLAPGCHAGRLHTHGDRQSSLDQPRRPFVRALPDVQEYVRLLETGESVTMRSGLVTLQPGEDCSWHSTESHEELVICLEGEGHIESGDMGRRRLTAGDYAYNPPHTRHNVFNTGTQPMRYVYVVAAVPEK